MNKKYIKVIIAFFLRLLLRVFYLIPINRNRFVFESFGGKIIGCNPFYIYRFICDKYPEYHYVWCCNKSGEYSGEMYCVSKNSFLYIYYLMTSKIYITNDSIPQYIPFRGNQIVINTWHGGGAYKKVGIELGERCDWYSRMNLRRTSKITTYFLSSSEVFSSAAPKAYMISSSKILPYGMPRNDLFFDKEQMNILDKKVRDYYHIDDGCFIILYAPTFRENNFNISIDFHLISESIKERFECKQVCFLIREHHIMTFDRDSLVQHVDSCIDVSSYQYMQDLLCAANMLISDYSSCIWDYSFTYRPCLLYVPDLSEYQSDRDFHNPIDTWGFPLARSNKELSEIILNFKEEVFEENMVKHHESLKSYEDGTATKRISRLILQRINK